MTSTEQGHTKLIVVHTPPPQAISDLTDFQPQTTDQRQPPLTRSEPLCQVMFLDYLLQKLGCGPLNKRRCYEGKSTPNLLPSSQSSCFSWSCPQ